MASRCDERAELLHKVRGSIEVARSMIDRSTNVYVARLAAGEEHVLAGLTDAADALSFVANVLEEQLGKRTRLGPAA